MKAQIKKAKGGSKANLKRQAILVLKKKVYY